MKKLVVLFIAFVAMPALAGETVSATIQISVIIDPQISVEAMSAGDTCYELLHENPAHYLESGCELQASTYTVSQTADDLLTIEPI